MQPYFCGNDERCRVFGNTWALQNAKENIEKHFSVVGLLEEREKTMAVLENEIPDYFKGALKWYHSDQGNSVNRSPLQVIKNHCRGLGNKPW